MRLELNAIGAPRWRVVANGARQSAVAVILVTMLACSSGAAAAGQLPTATPEQVGLAAAALHRLVDVLHGDVESGYIPGAVVFVARRGKTVLNEAVGWRDAERRVPMTTDSIFRLYSMTKPITSV